MKNGEKDEKKGLIYNSQNLMVIFEELKRNDFQLEEKEENPINTIPREEIIEYINEAQKTVLKWSLGRK